MVLSQDSGGTIVNNNNGWAKLGNGLVIVWGNGNAWNGGKTWGVCHAELPIKMKSIHVGLGNISSGLGAVLGIGLSTTGTAIDAGWDSFSYPATPTSWRYIVIGVPANPV